jgi:hypothetical protein
MMPETTPGKDSSKVPSKSNCRISLRPVPVATQKVSPSGSNATAVRSLI